ncbi:MAG: hypothetical protein FWD06_01920 [Oscillospiraceae bacterium]|nr:hypothetical protein [Oscillospiraceae bacterium]
MSKKILSTLLAAAMLLSFAAVAVAYDADYSYLPEPTEYVEIVALNVDTELQAQGRALITGTLNTFATGTYYLRGTATQPVEHDVLFDVVPMRTAGIAIAADDSRIVVEQTINWSNELGTFRGFLFRVFFGRRIRMVADTNDARIVFPGRRFFFSLADLDEDMPILNMESLDLTSLGDLEVPADLHVERANNYIRVTLENTDGGYTHFFYRIGQLRRIVTELPDEGITVIEVDSFSGSPASSLFSTGWMLYVPLGWFVRLFNA